MVSNVRRPPPFILRVKLLVRIKCKQDNVTVSSRQRCPYVLCATAGGIPFILHNTVFTGALLSAKSGIPSFLRTFCKLTNVILTTTLALESSA
jgi:hypothetical protein